MKGLVLYSDGGCDPNPGNGGWGFVAYRDGVEVYSAHGGAPSTTNNVMELTGALEALRWLAQQPEPQEARLLCDSRYVVSGCNSWRHKWKRNGWRRGQSPLANVELWQQIEAALDRAPIKLDWVRGHSGVKGNVRADALATKGRHDQIALASREAV